MKSPRNSAESKVSYSVYIITFLFTFTLFLNLKNLFVPGLNCILNSRYSPHSYIVHTCTFVSWALTISVAFLSNLPLDEVKMASHKQSFQCFDTITDDPSLKTPFPHGHCSSASFRGSSGSTRLESLEDHGCYLCADHQQAKAMASEATGIVLVKNSDPSVRKTIVLHRRSLRSLALFMDEVSELMQCLIRKLYTLEGHKVSLFWKISSKQICIYCTFKLQDFDLIRFLARFKFMTLSI
uniref:Uncharacterized LOC107684790 n=1 Tax=Sinocyclocheilus anshuiensis TaxID=1608454 RepID=A0A671Q838_9TELE